MKRERYANLLAEGAEGDIVVKLDSHNVIRNLSKDQKEILHNIMHLYNNDEPFDCDMTASSLKFYEQKPGDNYIIPEPEILFDVFPQQEKIQKIEPLGRLPLVDESISSLVCDLPFVVSPPEAPSAKTHKEGASKIFQRFYGYYPVDELYRSYMHWISEGYRVIKPGGIMVFKCQSVISGGISHNVEEWSFMCAQKCGFLMEDKFVLAADVRLLSPEKMKNQQHARKYTSVFLVFKKPDKKRSKDFDYFTLIDDMYNEEMNRYTEEN